MRLQLAGGAFIVVLLLTACGGHATRTAAPVVSVSPTSPPATTPCPIDQRICAFGVQLLPLLKSGDIDSLVRLSEGVPATCPSSGFGGPSQSLCAGARDGEVRYGYWEIQGEGLIVTEAEWRRVLGRWLTAIAGAGGTDSRGSGALRIGSVECFRLASQASGTCDGDMIRINFTFINAQSPAPNLGTGVSGQRMTFHISVHFAADGSVKADGFGMTTPPNAPLDHLAIKATNGHGQSGIMESYPWSP